MRICILFTTIVLLLASCNNLRTHDSKGNETPKTLDDKTSFSESYNRGYNKDLVEKLYEELLANTVELKELQDDIDELNKSESEAVALFNKYDSKNRLYYSAADDHIKNIKDSVLRERIKSLVTASLSNYQTSVNKHTNLLTSINGQKATLRDLHTALKITRTLPLLVKYQKENLPSTKPMEDFSKGLDKTIKKADTLVKK